MLFAGTGAEDEHKDNTKDSESNNSDKPQWAED